MSATGVPVDVDVLRDEIRKTYTDVSTTPDEEFIFPTGRAWAQELGYPEPELGRVPEGTAESFAGVANHWTLGRIDPGSVVLDLGCGAGTDLLIAAQMTGPAGRAIGVDMTAPASASTSGPAESRARSSPGSTRACWFSGPIPTSPRASWSTPTPARRSRTPAARPPSSAPWDQPSAPRNPGGSEHAREWPRRRRLHPR